MTVNFRLEQGRDGVHFRTSIADGTINTTRGGKPIAIGAIIGIAFRLVATDSVTGKTRTFEGTVNVPTRTTIPTEAQIKNAIQNYATNQDYRAQAIAYFSSFDTPPEITDTSISGIVNISAPDINP